MQPNNFITMEKRTANIVIVILALIIAFLLFDRYSRGEAATTKEVKPPSNTIKIADARKLTEEYTQGRYGIINDSLFKDSKYGDTRDFWFPLANLEEYLEYVKQESAKKGYTDLGIRIYLGAYPKDSDDPRADKGYATVILVPTHESKGAANGFMPMPPENSDDMDGLNYGQGGHPPKKL